jgi:hypothetical protein
MARPPAFTCLECGAKFSESRASAYKCDACAVRSEKAKQRHIAQAARREEDRLANLDFRNLLMKGRRRG